MLSPVRAAPQASARARLRSSRGRLHGCSRLSSLRWQSGLPLVKRRMAECTRTYLRGCGSQVPLPPSFTAWRHSWFSVVGATTCRSSARV